MLFRLIKPDDVKKNTVSDYKIYDFKFTPVAKADYYHETLMLSYAMMLTSSAGYLISQSRLDDAKKYLYQALAAKPNFQQALDLKRKFNL